jgi:outer membrane murein-binding lipoprotein Lpp
VLMDDRESTQSRVGSWEADLAERMEATQQLASRMSVLNGTAQDREGLVQVVVDAHGSITRLWLNEGIRAKPAGEISTMVLGTLRAAQADLARQVSEEAERAYGAGSQAATAIAENARLRFGLNGS